MLESIHVGRDYVREGTPSTLTEAPDRRSYVVAIRPTPDDTMRYRILVIQDTDHFDWIVTADDDSFVAESHPDGMSTGTEALAAAVHFLVPHAASAFGVDEVW